MATVKHLKVVNSPDDPTKEVSSNAWNADHVIEGLGTAAERNVGTGAADVAAGNHLHSSLYESVWTYAKLAADFTTSSASAVDVTGLFFTPLPNVTYELEGYFFVRTATGTVNPRVGLAWASGLADAIGQFIQSQVAAGASVFAAGNNNSALLTPAGGLPNTTQSWPVMLKAIILAGASPTGNVRIQLASETAATNVIMKAGSFIRVKAI